MSNGDIDNTLLLQKVHALMEKQEQQPQLTEGGGGGSGMDPWQSSVEQRLARLVADFRWTWAGLAAIFVILAGLALELHDRQDTKLNTIENTVIKIDQKIGTPKP